MLRPGSHLVFQLIPKVLCRPAQFFRNKPGKPLFYGLAERRHCFVESEGLIGIKGSSPNHVKQPQTKITQKNIGPAYSAHVIFKYSFKEIRHATNIEYNAPTGDILLIVTHCHIQLRQSIQRSGCQHYRKR